MSHQENIEESHSFVDAQQTLETKLLLSASSESFDFEDRPASSTPLPDSSNVLGSVDDIPATSVTIDANNQDALVEQPYASTEGKLESNRDDLESPSRLPHSTSMDSWNSNLSFVSEVESCGILGSCYTEYKYRIRMFRRKGFLLPFEIICLAFTIGCCYMGANYWPMCPADMYIPRYVFFNGALATLAICMKIVYSLWLLVLNRGAGNWKYCCILGFSWAVVIMTLVEMVEFYTMSYSFDQMETNYCNEVFYWFVYYKNMAFGVVMTLTALFYLPACKIYRNLN